VDILKSAFIVFLPLLFSFISQRFNIFILAYNITNSEFSIYDITLFLVQIISLPIFIFNIIILPISSKYFQNNKDGKKKVKFLYQIIIKIGLLYMIPLSILLFSVADYIILNFFPIEYLPSAFYLKHYLIYLNISMVGVVGANLLYASNQSKTVLKLLLTTSSVILVFSFLLIPIFKTLAAIYSMIIPYSIYLIASILIVKKRNNIKLDYRFYLSIFKFIISGIISILIVFMLKNIIGLELINIFHLIIFTGFYFTLFLLFSFMLKSLHLKDFIKVFNEVKNIFKFSRN